MLEPQTTFDRKIPIYVHIESLLRQQILTGRLTPQERLPTERELAAKYGVSQITIRTALSNLEAEKLIVRRRGKGTFVSPSVPVHEKIVVTGDIQSFTQEAARYDVEVLGMERKPLNQTRIARDLGKFFARDTDGEITVIRRLRSLHGRPMSFVENFISSELVEGITARDLSKRLLSDVLAERIDIRLGKRDSYLESVPAEADVARLLHSHVFAPLFLLSAQLWLTTGDPFQMVNIFMRPDYYKYKIDIGRTDPDH